MYLITEKLTSTIAVYMILKRVLKPWNKWEAYKHGIIDDKGKRLKRPKSTKEREGWDILDRFCWSIKRLCTKYLGDSQFAYLFSLVYLMKEQQTFNISFNIERYKQELDIDTFNIHKQKLIYECCTELDKIKFSANMDLETMATRLVPIVNIMLKKYNIYGIIPEDISCSDFAQFTPKINLKIKKRATLLKRRYK